MSAARQEPLHVALLALADALGADHPTSRLNAAVEALGAAGWHLVPNDALAALAAAEHDRHNALVGKNGMTVTVASRVLASAARAVLREAEPVVK